jgi:hypothetical protein
MNTSSGYRKLHARIIKGTNQWEGNCELVYSAGLARTGQKDLGKTNERHSC